MQKWHALEYRLAFKSFVMGTDAHFACESTYP
jgi:hypothetical protein